MKRQAKQEEDLVLEEQADGTTIRRHPKAERETRRKMLEKLEFSDPKAFKKSAERAMEEETEAQKKSDKPYIHTENKAKLVEAIKAKEEEDKRPELTSSMLERFREKSAPKKSFLERLRGK